MLATLHRMAPAAAKRVATLSVKPTAVALTQRRFNSTGTEVKFYNQKIQVEKNSLNFFFLCNR